MAMTYQEARRIKNKSLKDLITQNIVSGQGFGSSVGTAISDKFKAKGKRLKAKFDPLNIARMLTGSLGAAILGRLTGRKQEDVEYFTNKKSRGRRGYYNNIRSEGQSIDTEAFYTKISDGQNPKMRKGDSVADILAKMFNFMKKVHEEEIRQMEIDRDLAGANKAKLQEKPKTKTLAQKMGVEKEEESSWLKDLLSMLGKALLTLGSIYASLKGLLDPFIEFFKNLKLPEMKIPEAREVKTPKEETKKVEDKKAEESKRRRNKTRSATEEVEEAAGVAEGGATEKTGINKSRGSRLLSSLNESEVEGLKKKGINFDEKTQQFRKTIGNSTRRVDPNEISRMTGKSIPAPELTDVLGESRFAKQIKGVLGKFSANREKLDVARQTTTGKVITSGTKTVGYVAILVGLIAMAVEIVQLIVEYNSPGSEMTDDELETEITAVVFSAMVEFGVSSVVFMGMDAIVSVMTAAYIGPFALLAGVVAGFAAAAAVQVEFGSDINTQSKEFAREIIKRFINRDKIKALKESVFTKPLRTLDDFNEYQKKMAELTGTKFTPVDPNTAGGMGIMRSDRLMTMDEIKKAGGVGTPEGQRLMQEFNRRWPDSKLNLQPTNSGVYEKSSQLQDNKMNAATKSVVVNKPTTNNIGDNSKGIPVAIDNPADVRNDERSLIKTSMLSTRLV